MPSLSIVIPVFNEEQGLRGFHQELTEVIDSLEAEWRLYYIDDGSTDHTLRVLSELARTDGRTTVISLSRNFGHQAALSAGLDHAAGDAVIMMDGDGQHPPALIPEMVRLFQDGYEVVATQRTEMGTSSRFKRWTAAAFYWLVNHIGQTPLIPRAADFRLLSREVVEAIKGMHVYRRFLRGMVARTGFRTVILPYAPSPRIAGTPKHSVRRMLGLALDATFSFSLLPLQLGMALGIFFLLLACVEMIYVLSFWVRGEGETLAPGWSSLMFMILIVGGGMHDPYGFRWHLCGLLSPGGQTPTHLFDQTWGSSRRTPAVSG